MNKPRWLPLSTAALALAVACALFSNKAQQPEPIATPATPSSSPDRAPSSTPVILLTHISEQGHFLIQYPQVFRLYLEEKPSVDGVIAPAPNTISILSPSSPNYLLTIERFPSVGTGSLTEFISRTPCINLPATGQHLIIADEPALFFPDTLCGPYGSSLLFFLHSDDGYIISVESHARYDDIADSVTGILTTIRWISDQ
jgi:hypothetical protein